MIYFSVNDYFKVHSRNMKIYFYLNFQVVDSADFRVFYHRNGFLILVENVNIVFHIQAVFVDDSIVFEHTDVQDVVEVVCTNFVQDFFQDTVFIFVFR